jgi:RNA polymerase sigma-54 factor
MTPQLQQAIRLLQLSTLELKQEIQEALDTNLMLELEEEGERQERSEGEGESATPEAAGEAERELGETQETMPDDLPVDTDWDAIYDSVAPPVSGTATASDEERDNDFLQYTSQSDSLHDHLSWQLNLARFDERDEMIGEAIIDTINEQGYFDGQVADIATMLKEEGVEEPHVEAVLERIQQDFDPTGVAARDLRECLLLQLRQLPHDTPHLGLALRLVDKYFDALGKHDWARLRKGLRCDEDTLREVNLLIRSLDPRPGLQFSASEAQYVVPDVFVSRSKSGWRVELNQDIAPKLRVNSAYAGLIKRADNSEDNQTMRSHLQEARWFIKSVMSRNETLLRVATKIVEFQRAYFEYGEEAMKPLVLRDVAEALEMHESTVSRVTTRKYMHTPRGTLEFKYFFSSHVSTAAGGECSATAIRALIKKLVAAEEPTKPLSDSAISKLLKEQGINVARRTVAKYRESMAIAPSNERKRLA